MELGSQMDIDIASKMYRWPAFGDENAGSPRRVYMREVDMGTDRELFTEDPTGVPSARRPDGGPIRPSGEGLSSRSRPGR